MQGQQQLRRTSASYGSAYRTQPLPVARRAPSVFVLGTKLIPVVPRAMLQTQQPAGGEAAYSVLNSAAASFSKNQLVGVSALMQGIATSLQDVLGSITKPQSSQASAVQAVEEARHEAEEALHHACKALAAQSALTEERAAHTNMLATMHGNMAMELHHEREFRLRLRLRKERVHRHMAAYAASTAFTSSSGYAKPFLMKVPDAVHDTSVLRAVQAEEVRAMDAELEALRCELESSLAQLVQERAWTESCEAAAASN